MSEPKRLYRNPHDAMLGGVASGLAEYMGLDRTVVRVAMVLIAVFTLFVASVIAYVVMWAIVPPKPLQPVPAAVPLPPQP